MKQIIFTTMVLVATVCVGHATTTDELEITSGGNSALFTDGLVSPADPGTCTGTCSPFLAFTFDGQAYYDTNPGGQTITVAAIKATNLFNGWEINVAGGTSNSPALDPYGLDVGVLITCESSACVGAANELTITYSDTLFSTTSPALQTTYSGNETGFASTTSTAYSSSTDNLFATTNTIGTIGPTVSSGFVTTIAGTVTDGSAPAAPYSLTLADVFVANEKGASFSTDLNITSEVPEPTAVILFGTVLVLCASTLRRRLSR